MRISHSAMSMFLECKRKYFLNYMLRLKPTAKSSPLAFGDAIDVGLNQLLSSRDLASGIEKFEAQWLTYKDVGVQFTKSDLEEHLFNEGETPEPWESLRRRGIVLLEEFNEQIMPRIKEVVAVQIDQTVKNETQDELVIKTDFICVWEDGRRILFDNKTTSVKYPDDSVRKSEQLAIYYEVLKEQFTLDAAGYIVIPKKINKKKLPRVNISVLIDQIDVGTIEKTLEQYDQTLAQIKQGEFPQNRSACIGKYGKCAYYDWCHKGKLDGLEYK